MRDSGSIHDGYLTSRDGLALYFRERRMPDARAQILFVHGVAEHYGRYRNFEAFFAGHGIGLSMMDLRGHGQSEGRRVFVPSFEAYLDDLDVLVGHVQTHAQNVFLVGHSLGGVIAIRYAQTRKPRFRGLVTSGAALRPSTTPPRPIFEALKQINKLCLATPVPGLLKPEQVCRDAAIVRRYKSDPLVSKYITTGLAMATLDACNTAFAEAEALELPVLLLHGGADQVVDPRGTEEFFDRIRGEDKRLQLYPGLYHEIFNEPEREQVLTDVLGWVKERTRG
jgi:lysophospholipase